jgi:hypothetical protein
VQQVAVAGLHVDELVANFAGQPCGGDVVVDQSLEIVVGPDEGFVLGVDIVFIIQLRLVVLISRCPSGMFFRIK